MEIDPFWIIFCVAAPLTGVLIFAWGFWSERRQRARKIANAKESYEVALAALQSNPQSEDACQEALRLGTVYAELVMFDKQVPFDKSALLDQLNAARPGEEALTSLDEAARRAGSGRQARKLAELEELRQGGTLTAAEYQEQLTQILKE